MEITPKNSLRDIFDLIIAEFGNDECQEITGSSFISCGDNGEVTVSFRENTNSATICIYDGTPATVCNSDIIPVYVSIQKADSPIFRSQSLNNPSDFANKIIKFILQNIPNE